MVWVMVEYICSFAALTELSSCLSKQIIPHHQVWQPDCQRDVQHQWIRGRMVWKHLHIRCHTLWKAILFNSICYTEKKVQVVINDCALALGCYRQLRSGWKETLSGGDRPFSVDITNATFTPRLEIDTRCFWSSLISKKRVTWMNFPGWTKQI